MGKYVIELNNRVSIRINSMIDEIANRDFTELTLIREAARLSGVTPAQFIVATALSNAKKTIAVEYAKKHEGEVTIVQTAGQKGSRDADLQMAYLNLTSMGIEPTVSRLRRAIGTGHPTALSWWENVRLEWEKSNAKAIRAAKKAAKERKAKAQTI